MLCVHVTAPAGTLLKIWAELANATEKKTAANRADTPRLLSELFLKLPPRKDFPDYYKLIKKPVALTQVGPRFLPAAVFDSVVAINLATVIATPI
eukprot:COSAG05_NODE_716_length_7804_cov_2.669825_6_plen_95_part_00